MSAENSRARTIAALKAMLEEVAKLSEAISAERDSQAPDEAKLKTLSEQWIAANLKASELRRSLSELDDES